MKIALYTDERLLASQTSDTRYVYDGLAQHFEVECHFRPDASLCHNADVVFCRFPKPVNTVFLHQLRSVPEKLIINRPSAQLRFGTKRNLLRFPDLIAPSLISTSAAEIGEFASQHGVLVFKPLDKHKGQGVRKVAPDKLSERAFEDLVRDYIREHGTPLVQPFFEGIYDTGDKRINVVRFEPVSAVVTFPPEGSFICHEAVGGSAFPADITERDARIIEQIVPFLIEQDIWWTAIDIVGPYLSEINIATPAMIQRADRAHNDTRGLEAIVNGLVSYERDLDSSETS